MARVTSVNRDAVEAAALEILAEGGSPSGHSVFVKLGRKGSIEIVQGLVAEIRRDWAKRISKPEIPVEDVADPRLVAMIRQQTLDVQSFARELVSEQFVAKEAALAERSQSVDKALADASATVSATRQLATQLENELNTLRATLAGREALLSRLESTLDGERQLGASKDIRINELEAWVATSNAALADERKRTADERSHLMLQTDQIRKDKDKEISLVRDQLRRAVHDGGRVSEQLTESIAEVRRLRGEQESTRGDLRAALASMAARDTEITQLREENSRLQATLGLATEARRSSETALARAESAREAAERFVASETERANRAEAVLQARAAKFTKPAKPAKGDV